MFNCFCRKNKVSIAESKYIIQCNHYGYIIDIETATLALLLYEKQNIINKFIGIIMSPFMNYLHINVLLPRYTQMNNIQKNITHIFLSALSKKRPLIIYNILKEPIYILLSVNFTKHGFDICFSVNNDFNNLNIYTKHITLINKIVGFKPTMNKLVIIAIDFMNTSDQIITNNVLDYIDIRKRFHDDIVSTIKKYFYPYIYIHRITENGYILILNADWTFNITRYTTSLALSFIIQLIRTTREYVDIRCGVSYDNIYYGYIDNDLILIGKAKKIAKKMVNMYEEKYEIMCDNNFLNKLIDEHIFKKDMLSITKITCNFEENGMVTFYKLKILKNIYEERNEGDDKFIDSQ